jgi:hypothetical protein
LRIIDVRHEEGGARENALRHRSWVHWTPILVLTPTTQGIYTLRERNDLVSYNDVLQRADWLSSTQMYKRLPALVHLINDRNAWSSGVLYDAAVDQGYRMSYSTFQRDIDLCESMNFVSADQGAWGAGRSTLIAINKGAIELLTTAKIPCLPSRPLKKTQPRKI